MSASELVVSLINDVLSEFGADVPLSTVSTLIGIGIRKKLDEASSVLRKYFSDELSYSDLTEQQKEDFCLGLYNYYQFAIQGKAKRNLELMAKALKSQFQMRDIYVDKIMKYQDILASLDQDEIFILPHIKNCIKENVYVTGEEADEEKQKQVLVDTKKLEKCTQKNFITLQYVCGALARTGMIIPVSQDTAVWANGKGSPFYANFLITPLYYEVMELVENV